MIFDEKSPVYEIYRNIRNNIAFAKEHEKVKSILVTSYQENEGKTTVVANLAIALGNIDKRVLVIDGDLRNPSIHTLLKSKNDVGIVDLFKKEEDYSLYIKEFSENIDILTSGISTSMASEIIASNFMKNLILDAKDRYDYIIVDSHSLSLVSDASVLSTYCDGTILVGAYGEVEIDNVKKAKEILNNMGSNILGVILNKVE